MSHVMIDLETLGTQPGSVILSIGAVLFYPDETAENNWVGNGFYCVVNKESSLNFGMSVSQDTLDWWEKQSPEARKVLDESLIGGEDMDDALNKLAEFIPAEAKVWSNGANFDQPLLDVAYDRINKQIPWKYYNSRCYRTIVALHPDPKSIQPPTVCAHNALEDAKWQTKHMINVAKLMGLKL